MPQPTRPAAALLTAQALRFSRNETPVFGPLDFDVGAGDLGHLPAQKADLTALENLRFLCGLHGSRPGMSLEDAMATVGLAGYEDTLARQMSAGQRKRLSLARLWLSPAPLWLLDEPYANLDLEGIGLVNRMVQAHLREGGGAMVTTHGAYAAPPVRTRLLVLERAA
jgi:heme exporter protein A